MDKKLLCRHVVFTNKTKHVVSALFRKMEQAIDHQDQLHGFSSGGQYSVGKVYYSEDPADKSHYMVVKTHPEGLTLPITPPPRRKPAATRTPDDIKVSKNKKTTGRIESCHV